MTLVRLLDSLHTYEFIGLDLTCTDVSIRSIEVGAVVVDVGEGEGASLGVGVDVRQIQREAGGDAEACTERVAILAVGEGVVYRRTRYEYFGRCHVTLETSVLDGRRGVAITGTQGDAVAKHSFGTESDGVDTTKVRLQASVVFFEANLTAIILVIGAVAEAQRATCVVVVCADEAMTTDEVRTTESEAPVATQGVGVSCTLRRSDLKGLVVIPAEATCLEVHLHRVEGGRIE